jgi:hypothetical protein
LVESRVTEKKIKEKNAPKTKRKKYIIINTHRNLNIILFFVRYRSFVGGIFFPFNEGYYYILYMHNTNVYIYIYGSTICTCTYYILLRSLHNNIIYTDGVYL